jgi:hypothetical protein
MIYMEVIVINPLTHESPVVVTPSGDTVIRVETSSDGAIHMHPLPQTTARPTIIKQDRVSVDITADTGKTIYIGDSPVQMRVTATHIQWRSVKCSAWRNLIALSEFTGAQGDPGREIELSSVEMDLLWRYVGDTEWNILFDLSIFLTEETDPIAMEAIGDRQYSEENYVTSDDTLTKSIDDLDKAVQEFDNNSIELPSIELPSIELPSKEITIEPNHIVVTDEDNNIISVLLDTEEMPEIGRQIIIEKDLVEKTYTISLDETKVDHNNLLNWEAERHRHMVYDNDLKAYKIND